MQTGYNVKRPKLHPIERLRAWLHRPARETGRKCLHGRYPACNWYPPAMPPETKKVALTESAPQRTKHDCIVSQSADFVKED